MMTAESMLSNRPVLRFTVVSFFLLFSSHIYCIPIYFYKTTNMMITDKAYAGAYLGGAVVPCPLPPVTKRTKLMVPSDGNIPDFFDGFCSLSPGTDPGGTG